MVSRVARPDAFLRVAFEHMQAQHRLKFAQSTTTMVFKFRGGITLEVNSRTSMEQYIRCKSFTSVLFLCSL